MKQSQIATNQFLEEYTKIENEIINKDKIINYKNEIQFQDISFKYNNSNFLFENINFKIKFGEKVGIFGKSGTGKTSLVNIICGFLKPSKGKILIDGELLKDENYFSWQKKISLVEQNVYLFNDSIRNNIILNYADMKEDNDLKINEIIEKAQLTELINKLPDGLETIVNQNSTNISGGERQRIGIARAFYRNSTIIILDEPTSSLDEENSLKIMEILNNTENQTMIIISHDQEVLRICNTNYLLKNKQINKTL